ncbi:MAG TPA: MerR family transcriptional regulator [Trebonia sp.]
MTSAELTIAEVAERTGLTRDTLRYYERDGLMLGVSRADSGHRRYCEHDLGWIELIIKLRATGMPIREVRRYAELVRDGDGDGNRGERLALLRAHRQRVRAQLDTMTSCLAAIDAKISHYADATGACESPDSHLSSPRQATAAVPR